MILEVVRAKYISDFKILLEFNDGVVLTVDLENELNGTVFKPLINKDYFKKFSLPFNTLEWENGADFAPGYLYQIGKQQGNIKS